MSTPRLRPRDTFTLAALGALVAATVHVAWFLIRTQLLGRMVGASRELPWFSPITYFLCFLVVAIPLAVLARWLPRLASPALQGAVLGALTGIAVLLHAAKVHPAALIILALGVGVQAGRWVERDPAHALRVSRRAATGLAVVLLVTGLPGIVVYRLRQGAQVAALPAARAGAPNVLLLILDTVRAANLSAYGYHRRTTPVLQQLADNGTLFERAMAPAPWTGPTHAALLTGQYPFFTGISYLEPMTDSLATVTETFRANGYATGAFMGNAFFAGRLTGFDRAFIRYDDYPSSLRQILWSATFTQLDVVQRVAEAISARDIWRLRTAVTRGRFRVLGASRGDRYNAGEVVTRFLGWRDSLGDRPFFAMLNFFDAHAPYHTPFSTRFGDGGKALDRYDGAIAYNDSLLGTLVSELGERGVLDNTILLVTADHGEQFGEHGLYTHGNSLYLELLHVPLVVHAPGRIPAGARVEGVVSLRDVPATLLDLASLPADAVAGTTLAPLWLDSLAPVSTALAEADHPPNQDNRWPTSFGPMKAIVTDDYHYIRRGDGVEQVYRWKGDSTQADVTEGPEGEEMIRASRARLREELGPRWTRRSAGAS